MTDRGGPAPERAPDIEGTAGRAWAYDVREAPAGLAQYLIQCPGAHPAWSGWIISMIHLRPVPGMEPAKKACPDAEYEFMIIALDPSKPWPDTDDPMARPTYYLTPPDVLKQFHGVTDEQAAEFAKTAATACCLGWISPDQDHRALWQHQVEMMIEHHKGRHFDA